VLHRSGRPNRSVANEHRAVRQRGWTVLFALLLLVAGAGLGGTTGRGPVAADAAAAGAGTTEHRGTDGRDTAVVRAGSRPAILAQRSGDPTSLPVPIEPALRPDGAGLSVDAAVAAPPAERRGDAASAAPPRPYEARAPPATAA